jgi:hypothetical protein
VKPPQISLRDLLALIVVAALTLAWYADHRRLAERNDVLESKDSFWPTAPGQKMEALVLDDGRVEVIRYFGTKTNVHILPAVFTERTKRRNH